ncbi:23S rRNA (pseudouridine(1915)-N(3))-methyltransferase RlmH [bacterium]|nr:23S rRNA (pseudouridine(1915)-N(3))-methyltransferase RlmH [bacterium]
MGYRIKIYCVGRRHPSYLSEALQSFEKRLKGSCSFEWIILKTDKDLIEKLSGKSYYCFEVLGKEYTSVQFSKFICAKAHWNFVIGGALGIPSEVKKGAKGEISFSKFTFPHEMVRLLVLEQIYRAFEIEKNSPYHK